MALFNERRSQILETLSSGSVAGYQKHLLREMQNVQNQVLYGQPLQQLWNQAWPNTIGQEPTTNEHHAKLLEKLDKLDSVVPERIPESRVPDRVGTLTAWRAWRVEKHMLMALGKSEVWQPKSALAAKCLASKEHSCPGWDCNCGYWSFRSLDLLKPALSGYSSMLVVGTVDLWGKVIECENGYRSEFAYPKELWLLESGLEYLSWTYGVPVRRF